MQQPTPPERPRRRLWLLIFPFCALFTVLMVIAALYPLLYGPHTKERLNETTSVGNLRTLRTLESEFAAAHPKLGYACDLSSLSSAEFNPSNSASGYKFALSNCHSNANGLVVHYEITAVPDEPGTAALHTFCTDDSGTLWFSATGSAENCLTSRRLLPQ